MKEPKICIIGLGYVGLPLARLFATRYPVVGFDINPVRVSELRAGKDSTLEVDQELLSVVLLERNPVYQTKSLEPLNSSQPSRTSSTPAPASSCKSVLNTSG